MSLEAQHNVYHLSSLFLIVGGAEEEEEEVTKGDDIFKTGF
jgi:hypothetical protein